MANFTVTTAYANSQYASYSGYNTVYVVHGSINPTTITENDFSNASIISLYWSPTSNTLFLAIEGNYSKEALTSLVVNGSTYTGASSTHQANIEYNNVDHTRWEWSTTTNNFGTVNDAQIPVTINTASSAPPAIPAYSGDIADQTIAFDFTGDLALTISLNAGADSGEEAFKISETTQITNVIATTAPYYTSSTITIPAANLPTQGNTETYYIFAYRYSTADPEGDETYRLGSSFTVTRSANTGSGGDVGASSEYGVQIFDSSSNLTLDMSDRVAFFKATGSFTATGTATIDISVPGVLITDKAFTTETFGGGYSVGATIPSNGTVRINVAEVGYAPSNRVFNYAVINLGD